MEILVDISQVRLDRFLRKQLEGVTQGLIEKGLRTGKIKLNGKKAEASTRVTTGDVILLHDSLTNLPERPQTTKPKPTGVDKEDLRYLQELIIWEDDDICVINKPNGLAVQGGSKTTRHLDELLQNYQRSQPKGSRYLLVHRLDKDTSGVWVVAKNQEMARHLSECFESGRVRKVYWCLVSGKPQEPTGIIDAAIIKNSALKEKMMVDPKKGKKSQTKYSVIKSLGYDSWLACEPLTGRTHQIRVHLSYIGNPIMGDLKYGAVQRETLCLHARLLSFPDVDGNTLTFVAHPPKHIVSKLGLYSVNWEDYA